MLNFNVFDPRYKTPFGAIKTDEDVTIRISAETGKSVKAELLICEIDKWDDFESHEMYFEKEEEGTLWYAVKFRISKPSVYFFYFKVDVDGNNLVIKQSDNFESLVGENACLFQLTVYDKDFVTDENFKGGVIYQIFPDRFNFSGKKKMVWSDRIFRSNQWNTLPDFLPNENGKILNNDFFCGDLQGIIDKLDYLRHLSVTAIYLNPIFEAHSNHRYDTADYMKIDPLLGKEEDFVRLCSEAKRRGIVIILDGVFSHTGSDSIYFNKNERYDTVGAYNSSESIYRDWYKFRNYPDDYESWWGFDTLPTLDKTNASYVDYICGNKGVIHKWLSLGAYGFRLDVADELPDEFLVEIKKAVKKFGGKILIGEVWEDATTKISYSKRRRYLFGDELDTTMNYPFKNAIFDYVRYGSYRNFYKDVMQIVSNYPKPALDTLMNMLSTHDTERAITKLVGEEVGDKDRKWQIANHNLSEQNYKLGKNLLKIASVIQYFMPGIPTIYYGDEAGLSGYKDPFNRCCYPWGHEDSDLVNFYRILGETRTGNKMLKDADFRINYLDYDILVFERFNENETLVVMVNRGINDINIGGKIDLSGYERIFTCGRYEDYVLGVHSAVVFKK